MSHNYYRRCSDGAETVAHRREIGGDIEAAAAGFTHFSSARGGPWMPLALQGPGAPMRNRNAAKDRAVSSSSDDAAQSGEDMSLAMHCFATCSFCILFGGPPFGFCVRVEKLCVPVCVCVCVLAG